MSNSALDVMVGRVRQMLHNGEQQVTFTRETASMLVAGVEKLQRQLSAEQEAHAATIQREAKLAMQLDEAAKQEPVETVSGKLGEFDVTIVPFNKLYRLPPNLPALIKQAKAEEMEACAEVCDSTGPDDLTSENCAAAIRARKP